jgi:sortase A
VTLTEALPSPVPGQAGDDPSVSVSSTADDKDALPTNPKRLTTGRVVVICAIGILVVVVASGIVIYGIGPLTHSRDQRTLLASQRVAIDNAVHDNQGLHKAVLPTQPPVPSQPLGILAVPALGLQQVVVEGVGPSQTVTGPGHVPGTAGLGQPGNVAIVGRRAGYGGVFGSLDRLRPGDRIVTATAEGQSLYLVRSVRTVTLATTASFAASGHGSADPTITADGLYGPSSHDQLTLVTSGSDMPLNTDRAVVVVARLQGVPYTPTPQESRSASQQGNSGDPAAVAALALAVLALAATLVGAVFLYRRTAMRTAYLLSTAPLLAFTVLAAEAGSRLLPAWL